MDTPVGRRGTVFCSDSKALASGCLYAVENKALGSLCFEVWLSWYFYPKSFFKGKYPRQISLEETS